MNKRKQNNIFLESLSKLNPVEAYGLAKIMCISVFKGKELKTGEQLLFDLVEKFPTLGRLQRKQIIELLTEVKNDGLSTENKEEQ